MNSCSGFSVVLDASMNSCSGLSVVLDTSMDSCSSSEFSKYGLASGPKLHRDPDENKLSDLRPREDRDLQLSLQGSRSFVMFQTSQSPSPRDLRNLES